MTALAGHGRVLWPLVKLGYECPRAPPLLFPRAVLRGFGGFSASSIITVASSVTYMYLYVYVCGFMSEYGCARKQSSGGPL